jgi:hypothetical protein
MPYKDSKVRLIKQRAYVQAHKELYKTSDKKYKLLHPEKVKEHQRNWKQKNREHIRQYQQKHRKNNPEMYKQYDKTKLEKHGEVIKKKRKESNQLRMKTDSQYHLAKVCRNRVRAAVLNQKTTKSAKTLELLGCTLEQLKIYLESKFYPNKITGEMMTWDNHSKFGWHIDHIKPVDSFDLTNPDQQKVCFNWSNLQPLWWDENLSKGSK